MLLKIAWTSPTDPFTILEPGYPSIDAFHVVWKHRRISIKLYKIVKGSVDRTMMGEKFAPIYYLRKQPTGPRSRQQFTTDYYALSEPIQLHVVQKLRSTDFEAV